MRRLTNAGKVRIKCDRCGRAADKGAWPMQPTTMALSGKYSFHAEGDRRGTLDSQVVYDFCHDCTILFLNFADGGSVTKKPVAG